MGPKQGGGGLVQLSHVIDSKKLYSDYLFVSRTSPSLITHFDNYAKGTNSFMHEHVVERHGGVKNSGEIYFSMEIVEKDENF